jgi:beta-galactosidase
VSDTSRDGTRFRHVFDVPEQLADLPRVGVTFRVSGRFDRMRWFGRGPHENYPDRSRSAMLGVWEADLDELPYLVPQEFGLRTDCRWLELIDPASGERIRFDEFSTPLHCSATRYDDGELYRAETSIDAAPADHVVVHLDLAHRGLGTASCGPDVLPRYRLGAGRFELSYRVTGTA